MVTHERRWVRCMRLKGKTKGISQKMWPGRSWITFLRRNARSRNTSILTLRAYLRAIRPPGAIGTGVLDNEASPWLNLDQTKTVGQADVTCLIASLIQRTTPTVGPRRKAGLHLIQPLLVTAIYSRWIGTFGCKCRREHCCSNNQPLCSF